MKELNEILRKATMENAEKIDWTKAWSTKYPILKTYQQEVDITGYSDELKKLLSRLQNEYGYSELDAMLVLKDILAHTYLDKKNKIRRET